MNLRIVRLHSGEEILCRVEETHDGLILHKGMILIPDVNGSLGFQVFMPYSKAFNGLFVPFTYIAYNVEPDETLASHYETNVEDKPMIAVPDKKIITG